ncbi:hypothetical protein JDV02_007079 [Purpureocillium takamizusanense]|uniref:DH domain-containing protein n=1 Tax=Purpureocillium takamizusanense TaxID=2060973 RepID=A0A9Q8QM79_9HYPO|nr:uncharacterized protein JDV02_007079 [Purpureocillium takamizusanense]UNI21052.1 hypothetical protein JDV02_007079 [Purpureocillium takamizusanense]
MDPDPDVDLLTHDAVHAAVVAADAAGGVTPSFDTHSRTHHASPHHHHHLLHTFNHRHFNLEHQDYPQGHRHDLGVAYYDDEPNEFHHDTDRLSPDHFYRSHSPDSDPDAIPMASSTVVRPSLRSNGDGTTPRHPTLAANRTLPRSNNVRAVSSPVDSRQPGSSAWATPKGKPSVKDLKKKFDQNGGVSSIPRAPLRPGATPPHHAPTGKANAVATAYSELRTGASARVSSTQGRNEHAAARGQRSRFVAEDAVSSNSQSFASRIGKPRSLANGKMPASKSMTQLSHEDPHRQPQLLQQPPQPPSPPANARSHGLLFGEILPDEPDTAALGFGIDRVRPQRTPDSRCSAAAHNRSFSDPELEPPSPSTWYRQNATEQNVIDAPRVPPAGHSRSQSDAAASHSDAPTLNLRQPLAQSITVPAGLGQPSTTSKLPVSIRKPNSPSPSSPTSTRSSSPTAVKRSHVAARTSRAKTPTQRATGRRPPPPSLGVPNSSRLQAYIAAPPPALSPPLRSSRPRQTVSAATGSGSREKEAGGAKARDRFNPNGTAKGGGETARRRKISIGPIDFEQRREHIRLAYSKSIRESQAHEARREAAERRQKDMESAAKAKPKAEGDARRAEPSGSSRPHSISELHESPQDGVPDHGPEIGSATTPPAKQTAETSAHAPIPPLVVSTAESLESAPAEPATPDIDSPTLGVPGSFPSLSPPQRTEKRPLSILSATSETTEFDGEPQTTPPTQAQSPLEVSAAALEPEPSLPKARAEYHSPFEDDADFHDTPVAPEPTVSASDNVSDIVEANEHIVPGAFTDEAENTNLTLHTLASHGTTVTVVPATDEAEAVDPVADTVPFPRMDVQDDSDCQSESDGARGVYSAPPDDDAATDACTEETDEHDRVALLRPDFGYVDQLSSHRTSTCASSDADVGQFDDDMSSNEINSSNLTVPQSSTQHDRLSRQSAWTDYSVGSTDPSDVARSTMHSQEESPVFGHVTIFESMTTARESLSSYRANQYVSDTRDAADSTRSSLHFGNHQLPELDTGGGFSIPYLSTTPDPALTYLPSPSHEPPAVPSSALGSALNSRTSSVFYDQSQFSSTLINSERGSDEYLAQTETPQSMEPAEQLFGSRTTVESDVKSSLQEPDEPSGKERHRLVQRRNVIKELVDTEAVFVRDMNIVEEIYKGTAEACPKLDSKTVKLIFRNSDEIIDFHTAFLAQLKDAVAPVYMPKGGRTPTLREDSSILSDNSQRNSTDPSDVKDRATLLGSAFQTNLEKMKAAHEGFLRNSDQAAKRLIQIQQDATVKVWLNECNEVAKDLTAAWDLDSLLIKPMQRITKYPNLIITLLQHTPQDHPDRESLMAAKDALETAIIEINKTKKNFELVGQIVGRKRKESDVRAGFARAFGKKVDKLQAPNSRVPEDVEYAKLNERFGDDYLRLQVVLRDVEFYTRQVSAYVHEFLQYMSSIELVMRLQPGSYPELESKWVQFNISVRDLEKVALEDHLAQVRKHVIEPFEHVIKAYGNPSLAMKKRQKRRLDYERSELLKRAGKSVDPKLKELVEQYEALNDTLKKELPMLSSLTERVGNICLGNFVNIQASWYGTWRDKMKTVLSDSPEMPELDEVVATFQRDFPYAHEQVTSISILNPAKWGIWARNSQSTTTSLDDSTLRSRSRPSDVETRDGEVSTISDTAPSLPSTDFGRRRSGSLTGSTGLGNGSMPNPHQYYYRDYYSGLQSQQGSFASPKSPELAGSSRSAGGTGATSTRPSTGRSFDSAGVQRQSLESSQAPRRDSTTTYNSSHQPQESRRFSNLFHSALPLPDGAEESQRSSRASSRERRRASDGYNILWLAASLFEFNIATTKHEAGYPYLTYQAGEIFDVIAEKGELWLAKNQDDPMDQVGWIWSKHFAKLADS